MVMEFTLPPRCYDYSFVSSVLTLIFRPRIER